MYGDGFGRNNLSQVVEMSGQVTIAMTADLE